MVQRVEPIYLDYHATTPSAPEVIEAMLPWFGERFGNPASTTHRFGKEAAHAVEAARVEVAALIGADPRTIVFTSGATEALNLALKGLAAAHPQRAARIVASAIEHQAVLDTIAHAPFEAVLVKPDARGIVQPETIDPSGALAVCVMAANNEIGTLQPVQAIAQRAHAAGAFMICDASQAVGKVPFAVGELDLVAFTAHKLYGPKGIGALYVRRRPPVALAPLISGGGHERGLRSGTLNVPAIVGFGVAARLAREHLHDDMVRIAGLRDELWAALQAGIPHIVRTTDQDTLPGNLHVSIPGLEAWRLLDAVPELAVSAGSACQSAELEPSHVLSALGLSDRIILGSLRIGLGRPTTRAQVERAAALLSAAVRALSA